jgi:hypothetical protein
MNHPASASVIFAIPIAWHHKYDAEAILKHNSFTQSKLNHYGI